MLTQIVLPFIENISSNINKIVLRLLFGILIFLFGFILGRLVGRSIYKILKEFEINKFIKTSTGLKINADHLISGFISYSIYFLALVAALDQIGLSNIILYLLSGAIILVILISFFIAIRDFVPNLLSGIYLYGKAGIKEGKTIEVNDVKGKLIHIDLLQVKLETKNRDILFLPNSLVAKSKIKIKKR